MDKAGLKDGLLQLQKDMMTREVDSMEEWATRMSDLIEVFVKSAKVKVGITVSTTGTATQHTGQTTSQGELI